MSAFLDWTALFVKFLPRSLRLKLMSLSYVQVKVRRGQKLAKLAAIQADPLFASPVLVRPQSLCGPSECATEPLPHQRQSSSIPGHDKRILRATSAPAVQSPRRPPFLSECASTAELLSTSMLYLLGALWGH
jgi:hypothetical protein